MSRVVGFLLHRGLDEGLQRRSRAALDRALSHYPWLARRSLSVGETTVELWGHGDLGDAVEQGPAGIAFLAGHAVPAPDPGSLLQAAQADGPVPWEGRLALVSVAADGASWTIANDWTAALPVFHAGAGESRIAGTLEPAVVAGAGLGPADLSPADVASLLTHGYFLGARTLYRGMQALAPDVRAAWGPEGHSERSQGSVAASAPRATAGWAELVEELAHLTDEALRRALSTAPRWNIALSGGLDSRLIAACAVDLGLEARAYTYGQKGWPDIVYARRSARMLGIPWRYVELDDGYMARRKRAWTDVFGTSMHVHGTYQFPLLEAIGGGGDPLAMGYTGDPLGGAQTEGMAAGGERSLRGRLVDKWHMWSDEELAAAARFDVHAGFAELESELDAQAAAHPGDLFQQLWFVFQHNQMARMSNYQPTLHDWWSGVGCPFMDRDLARFALSVPRALLEGRRLQIAAFAHRYPALATIPGTFDTRPAAPSGRHYLKRTLADLLPARLHAGPLREFAPAPNAADQRALAAGGAEALWPIGAVGDALDEWIDPAAVQRAVTEARAGDLAAIGRVEAVQALALALLPRAS